MKDQKTDIGQRIRAQRKARRWSQEELAGRSGRSVFTLSQIERGVNLPNLATLIDLVAALECSLDDIVRRTGRAGCPPKSREHLQIESQVLADITSMDLKTLRAVQNAIKAIFEAQDR